MKLKNIYKILIVGDDKDMCKVVSTALMQEGYEIFMTHDSKQAIKKINANNYNLVIVIEKGGAGSDFDRRSPDIYGIEVLQKIQNMGLPINVIMISVSGNDLIKSKVKKLGIGQFLDKPFNPTKFIKIVKKTISKN